MFVRSCKEVLKEVCKKFIRSSRKVYEKFTSLKAHCKKFVRRL
jgi:hypothetical protein